MTSVNDSIEFEFQNNGTSLQQALGAIYALERLDIGIRQQLVPVMLRAMKWRGPIGGSFIEYLAGTKVASISVLADPRAWALETLGFPGGTVKPGKRDIMAHYRDSVRRAHPDHGGNETDASKLIIDITEARRVLLESL
jgi:hypothetical protein